MKAETKQRILEAYNYCAEKDKSMEYTIEYIMDTCKVNLDCVMTFLETQYTKTPKP